MTDKEIHYIEDKINKLEIEILDRKVELEKLKAILKRLK